MLLIGRQGSGKSSIANVIAGQEPSSRTFPVLSEAHACTTEPQTTRINFRGDISKPIIIIDTPGFDERNGVPDQLILAKIRAELEAIQNINLIGLIINGQSPRLDATTLLMITVFESILGDGFWSHMILVFTKVLMDAKSKRKRRLNNRKSDDEFARDYIKDLMTKFRLEDLQYLFIDAWYDKTDVQEEESFRDSMERFYSILQIKTSLVTSDLHENVATETLQLERLSLLRNKEEEILHTPLGKLFRKTIQGNPHSVFKMADKDTSSMMTEEAERMRKNLNHENIVKLHHSYLEKEGSIRCFVLEPLIIADGTLATVAQQRVNNLREFNMWRDLSWFSSALAYIHSQQSTTGMEKNHEKQV